MKRAISPNQVGIIYSFCRSQFFSHFSYFYRASSEAESSVATLVVAGAKQSQQQTIGAAKKLGDHQSGLGRACGRHTRHRGGAPLATPQAIWGLSCAAAKRQWVWEPVHQQATGPGSWPQVGQWVLLGPAGWRTCFGLVVTHLGLGQCTSFLALCAVPLCGGGAGAIVALPGAAAWAQSALAYPTEAHTSQSPRLVRGRPRFAPC